LNLTLEKSENANQNIRASTSKIVCPTMYNTSFFGIGTRKAIAREDENSVEAPEFNMMSILTNISKDLEYVPKDKDSRQKNYNVSLKIYEDL